MNYKDIFHRAFCILTAILAFCIFGSVGAIECGTVTIRQGALQIVIFSVCAAASAFVSYLLNTKRS